MTLLSRPHVQFVSFELKYVICVPSGRVCPDRERSRGCLAVEAAPSPSKVAIRAKHDPKVKFNTVEFNTVEGIK